MHLKMNKKAELEEMIKVILWIVVFLALIGGIVYLAKLFMG